MGKEIIVELSTDLSRTAGCQTRIKGLWHYGQGGTKASWLGMSRAAVIKT